jgi:hypothetical protein
MAYNESRVRLREHGLVRVGFYKITLVISLAVNALLIAVLWNETTIASAFAKAMAVLQ